MFTPENQTRYIRAYLILSCTIFHIIYDPIVTNDNVDHRNFSGVPYNSLEQLNLEITMSLLMKPVNNIRLELLTRNVLRSQ